MNTIAFFVVKIFNIFSSKNHFCEFRRTNKVKSCDIYSPCFHKLLYSYYKINFFKNSTNFEINIFVRTNLVHQLIRYFAKNSFIVLKKK